MLKRKIQTFLKEKIKQNIMLLTPKNPRFGDFALHARAVKSEKLKVKSFMDEELFEKVEEKAGFINFFISKKLLIEELEMIIQEKENYGKNNLLKNQKIMIEFAHPNTHKLFHVGHLRNIILGDSLSRIFTAAKAQVIRANYQGDVGLHIAKCLWKVKSLKSKVNPDLIGVKSLKNQEERMSLLGQAYTEGNKAYEKDEKAKKEIHEINQQIFEKNPAIMPLWEETRKWSLEYFESIYKRLNVHFDRLYFENEVADVGKKIALHALEKGILNTSDGAIIFDGEKYNVDTRVFINSLGIPTYEGKELGLAQLEFTEFGVLDRCIHVVAAEQTSFFKTVFKVEELLNDSLYKNKQRHLVYGMVRLRAGKMSSREGTVIEGEILLNEVKNKLQTTFSSDEKTAELVAIGAVKYAFLKTDSQKDIIFDIDESISLQGNSGPFVLYAYARTQSVLKKNKSIDLSLTDLTQKKATISLPQEENNLLRILTLFPESVESAITHYSPHLLCTYVYEVAHAFNFFYEKLPILKTEKKDRQRRIALTRATGIIVKNTLSLLGIKTIDAL